MPSVFLTIAVVVGHIYAVHSQSLSSTIVGCIDVDCPTGPGSITTVQCTVVDKTFHTIRLAPIELLPRTTTLETPPDTNLTGTGACAVFFGKVSDRASFSGSSRVIEESEGTCQEAIGTDCVNALVKRATNVDVKGLGNVEACSKLETAFKENLDDACKSIATDSKWKGLSVKGNGAAKPITTAQNSTSNCWPIVPKQYDLALVNSADTPGDFTSTSVYNNLFGITPILTLFYPGNGSLITEAEAQMTCMKTKGLNSAENATKANSENGANGEDDDKKIAGIFYGPNIAALIIALAFWTLAPF
ncbi:uncharacterized protein BP5553_04287 [Venustampulla echinocandica]|uniref:Uncharacterized protein n=1 Tax=Venustampulla echinocandica TaxID=2656787 RepID=A0A370TWP7_9HELO|nr:uncharacterized protein BP5553_04287 [Venustampulla echinocandica]RDL39947.1 hypothetical protein BP5553_04287 [Venustampulla echinocandica]